MFYLLQGDYTVYEGSYSGLCNNIINIIQRGGGEELWIRGLEIVSLGPK